MAENMTEAGLGRPAHKWRFFRVGGFDQVSLDGGEDLRALDQLDQKLWLALSCPTRGLEFDARTLDLMDTDRDGRIRVPEVLAAVRWICSVLKDPDYLVTAGAALPLSAINDASPQGAELLGSAVHILTSLGKPDAAEITVEDASDTAAIFAKTRFNGDGIVPAEAAEDEATRAVIGQMIDCLGAVSDRSGKPGVSQEKAVQFFAQAQAYSDWWQKAESDPAVLPLGQATSAAADALRAVKVKVDDYFVRCRLAAYDPGLAAVLNPQASDCAPVAGGDLSLSTAQVAALPLARVGPDRPLPLGEGLNPAWAHAIARLRHDVVAPLLGPRTGLAADEWADLVQTFAAFEAWSAAKAGAAVEKLGLARVRELLAGSAKDAITALIVRDNAFEPQVRSMADVERLVRYHRDLHTLLKNFVSFRDFYSRKTKAIFQAGTLYLDGRSCELCIRVEDMAKHGAFAGMSRCYLAYCDCARPGGEKMSVVAAFTGGDSDFLMVGRNGVFYDRKGRDWDTTITKVVVNPISVRQAFWAPYKRAAQFVEDQIEKFAAARDQAATDRLAAAAADGGPKPEAAKTAAGQAFDIAKFAGIFAAIGLAVGAIGTAIAAIASRFLVLSPWQMPLAIAAAMLVISAPSMLLASMKLRQRNLGPILEANGWAVNARVRINIPFGRSLTGVASLPAGARLAAVDPFAEKRSPWPRIIVALILLALALYALNEYGCIHKWTGFGTKVEVKQDSTPRGGTAPPMPQAAPPAVQPSGKQT